MASIITEQRASGHQIDDDPIACIVEVFVASYLGSMCHWTVDSLFKLSTCPGFRLVPTVYGQVTLPWSYFGHGWEGLCGVLV